MHKDLAERLDSLEEKTESLAMQHGTFSRNTRNQLRQVFEALRGPTVAHEPVKRPIGFVTHEEKEPPGGRRRARRLDRCSRERTHALAAKG